MDGFVLTVCQRKGGVGRSTLLYNLAGAMALRGLRVLTVDLDPQASISQLHLGPEAVDTLLAARTVVALMDENFRDFAPISTETAGEPSRFALER